MFGKKATHRVKCWNRILTSLLALPLLVHPASAQNAAVSQSTWTIDKIHSHVGFSVAHFVITQVTGYFRDYDALVTCTCPDNDFTGGTVEFTAKTASVFTDNEQRDGHLRTDAFFNAGKYPEMKFKGALVNENGKNVLKGNLTIRDITRPVSLNVTYGGRIKDKNLGIEKAAFKVTGTINRLDYGLKWNETFEGGGAIVGEEVELDLNVEIDKRKPAGMPAS
jgi:polyisoprenoid-binding protein YceI